MGPSGTSKGPQSAGLAPAPRRPGGGPAPARRQPRAGRPARWPAGKDCRRVGVENGIEEIYMATRRGEMRTWLEHNVTGQWAKREIHKNNGWNLYGEAGEIEIPIQ